MLSAMSMLSSALADLRSLFLPAHCMACEKTMENREDFICVECRAKMPTTGYHLRYDNPMAERLRSMLPRIEGATAMFFYINKGSWRHLIHNIKYHNMWRAAVRVGYWYGCQMRTATHFQDIDYVVPIPLHRARRVKRGYNQSEKIAQGIAEALNVKMLTREVVRLRNNPSQVTRSRLERWSNVEALFNVKHPEQLAGRHILLVDDVFTTGATMISCAESIFAKAPTVRISVATLAALRRQLGEPI